MNIIILIFAIIGLISWIFNVAFIIQDHLKYRKIKINLRFVDYIALLSLIVISPIFHLIGLSISYKQVIKDKYKK